MYTCKNRNAVAISDARLVPVFVYSLAVFIWLTTYGHKTAF